MISNWTGGVDTEIWVRKDLFVDDTCTLKNGDYLYFKEENDDIITIYDQSCKWLQKKHKFEINKKENCLYIDHKPYATAEYEIKKIPWMEPDSLQMTLLYNGKIGNRIKFGYREFINDMARTAFSNEVEYDLSDSKEIGYKCARLEVITATNNSITYKVLHGFYCDAQ